MRSAKERIVKSLVVYGMRFQTILSPMKNKHTHRESFELVLRVFKAPKWFVLKYHNVPIMQQYYKAQLSQVCVEERQWRSKVMVLPALLGFSATQAMVMPPISESLKRNRKVPLGLDISMSWACCLFTKPRIALRHTNAWTQTLNHKRMFTHTNTERLLSCVYCSASSWFVYKGLQDMTTGGWTRKR